MTAREKVRVLRRPLKPVKKTRAPPRARSSNRALTEWQSPFIAMPDSGSFSGVLTVMTDQHELAACNIVFVSIVEAACRIHSSTKQAREQQPRL
ncbi:hypothetical protein ElyMa_005912900 [Elysia marginata]|uniref:Uncharacterized protein n=1 Tax=Elysia marginata TaxID=1093978 RepID=A0AAV4G7K4_9GAST|nr:hypothetical protein ElyMa_005912900 [Elysia marginata]